MTALVLVGHLTIYDLLAIVADADIAASPLIVSQGRGRGGCQVPLDQSLLGVGREQHIITPWADSHGLSGQVVLLLNIQGLNRLHVQQLTIRCQCNNQQERKYCFFHIVSVISIIIYNVYSIVIR